MISDHTVREGLAKALDVLRYIDIDGMDLEWHTEHDKGRHNNESSGGCGLCVIRELTNALNASGAA